MTRLLQGVADGDAAAAERLLERVGGELHAIARVLLRDERADHTLQPTALVNEAWLRLMGPGPGRFEDRAHFLRVAARAMRRTLVDHARARGRAKRGGGRTRLALDEAAAEPGGPLAARAEDPVDLLDLEAALERLEARDPELARVVELRFFAGLTLEETGRVLGITERAVRWGWDLARGFLRRELDRAGGAASDG